MIKKIQAHNLFSLFSIIALSAFLAVSCSDDDTIGPDPDSNDIIPVKNLEATTSITGTPGEYTFYSLRENRTVSDSASTDWDIGFSGAKIIFNNGPFGDGEGGASIAEKPFDTVTQTSDRKYDKFYLGDMDEIFADLSGGEDIEDLIAELNNSTDYWFTYSFQGDPKHTITPKNDYTILVQTADGNHHAKIKIKSWYKDNPDPSELDEDPNKRAHGYFTFDYVLLD